MTKIYVNLNQESMSKDPAKVSEHSRVAKTHAVLAQEHAAKASKHPVGSS